MMTMLYRGEILRCFSHIVGTFCSPFGVLSPVTCLPLRAVVQGFCYSYFVYVAEVIMACTVKVHLR